MKLPQLRGRSAEQQARRLLERHGLKTLERNYHCRLGEIDLIMQDGDSLVFVEVRYRGKGARGGARESIDARKQSKLIATALHYLQQHRGHQHRPTRFDVIAADEGADPPFEWIKDAFRP